MGEILRFYSTSTGKIRAKYTFNGAGTYYSSLHLNVAGENIIDNKLAPFSGSVDGLNHDEEVELLQPPVIIEAPVTEAPVTEAPVPVVVAGKNYEIKPKHLPGFCLDVHRASHRAGTAVNQYPCHGRANQSWEFISVNDNNHESTKYFRIKNTNSKHCLSVMKAGVYNGVPATQWHCRRGKTHQLFKLVQTQTTYGKPGFRLEAKHSGKCLTISHGSHRRSAALVQFRCDGEKDHQVFEIVEK